MDPATLEALEFTDEMTDQNQLAAIRVEKITLFLRTILSKYMAIPGRGMCAAPALQMLWEATAKLEQAALMMKGPSQVQPVPGALPRRIMN